MPNERAPRAARLRPTRRQFVLVLLVSFSGKCGAFDCFGSGAVEPLPDPNLNCVNSLSASPRVLQLEPGQQTTLTLTSNDVCVNLFPTWTSSDPGVAQIVTSTATATTIDVRGVAVGGPVTITVTKSNKSDNITVGVSPSTVQDVVVTPNPVAMVVGGAPFTLTATVTSPFGVALNTVPTLAWTTSNNAVATVSPTGARTASVTAVAAGNVIITAGETASNKSGSSVFTVTSGCSVLASYVEDFSTGSPFTQTVTQTGGASHIPTYKPTSGNPGGYLEMAHLEPSPSDISVLHLNPTRTYNPSVQGAIDHLEYEEDRIVLAPPFPGAQIGTAIFVTQNGTTYLAALTGGVFTSTTWERAQRLNLRASNFSPTSPALNFGTTGGPIQFGFVRRNSSIAGGGLTTRTHGIDNWAVRVCQ